MSDDDIKQVAVRLGKADRVDLDRACELDRLDQSNVIRRAIRFYRRKLECDLASQATPAASVG